MPTYLTSCIVGLFLIGCQSLPEPIQPVQQTIRTNANARLATGTGVCGYDYTATTEADLKAAGWNKTFEDNFDTNPSDPANPNWNVWVGGSFNNELQLYTSSPRNLTITQDPDKAGNSLLVIQAIKEKVTGPKYRADIDATPTNFDFTSARIESKTLFGPNRTNRQVRMVARIKLPTGYGTWPAFWSYGDQWPTNGEIDVLEARGNEPHKYQTNYFYGTNPNQNLVTDGETFLTLESSLTECWHVYEVIWTKESLTFLLDGQQVAINAAGYVPELFGKLQKLTLNEAVGGSFFSNPTSDTIPLNPGEGKMLVDWVKVFVKR